jgi:hypothetical protein
MIAALVEASGVDPALLRAAGVVTRMTDFGSRFAMKSSPEITGVGTLPGVDDSGIERAIIDVGALDSRASATTPSASAETVMVGATQAGVSRTSPSEPPARRRAPVGLIVGVIAFLCVGVVVASLAMARGTPTDTPAPASESGAVIPAEHATGTGMPVEPPSAEGAGLEVAPEDPPEAPQEAPEAPQHATSADQPTAEGSPDQHATSRPVGSKPVTAPPTTGKPSGDKPPGDKPVGDKPASGKPAGDESAGGIDIGF